MPINITNHTLVFSVSAAAAALLAGSAALSLVLSKIPEPHARTAIPSPRTTLLPYLDPAQRSSLGYPPDASPGARDVSTPYGWMRVYEWGPENGRRVVMVHGDATPAPLFTRIADQLVSRGCRVLTFDTWGRGYTDTPHGIQHDSRLYAQQILYAITSSPVPWTGQATRFSLVGFSLGGTISLDFFAHQPDLVESVVLLGPAGLLRSLPASYRSFWFRRPGLVSKAKMRSLIADALGVDNNNNNNHPPTPASPLTATKLTNDNQQTATGFTPARALQFQFDHHQGHVDSFLSTLQYGPAQAQVANWSRAGDIVRGRDGGRILVICGQDDTVVKPAHVLEDLGTYFGAVEGEHTPDGRDWSDGGVVERKHFVFRTVPGDHGFPWPQGTRVGEMIAEFWGI